tara:strand:- start:1115 stop:1363 length:249 start_codon:yes stop_codon:yes gene_type:complete
MDKKFLEDQIEKAKEDLAFHKKQLENEQQKVSELANAKITNLDILRVLTEARKMEKWYEKGCKEDLLLLDIFYTARDCTSTK